MTDVPSHRWAPLEDLPIDWSLLASPELRGLSGIWTEQKVWLTGTAAMQGFTDRLHRQWAIETGIIERIYTLDRGVTELLIERGIDASLIPDDATDQDPEAVVRIVRDQESAVDWLFDVVRGGRALSLSFVKELHALMTRHQLTTAGRDQLGREVEIPLLQGDWKVHPNNPTRPDGSIHEYSPPEQVASEMERLLQLHEEHERHGVPPEVEAAWLHHRFTQVHPFQDGNGRIARALASLVFIKAGWFPLVVTRDDRGRYLDALEAADNGDLAPLVSLFASLERKAFLTALSVAREVLDEALEESEPFDELIASVRDMYAIKDEAVRLDWERVKDLAERLALLGSDRLQSVADRLTDELGSFSSTFRFVVDAEPDGGDRSNWYRSQTNEAARVLGLSANNREYSAWVHLGLHTDTRADVLLAFTAIGPDVRGLIGAAVIFFRRAQVEEAGEQVVDVAAASDELFQINYKEDESSVVDRFGSWIDRGVVRALEMWRQGL